MPQRIIFVAGTDTQVGKTFIASRLAHRLLQQGHSVGVYKPVASGCTGNGDDSEILWRAAGKPLTLDAVCPQSFAAPLSPPRAAQAEGKQVDQDRLLGGLKAWEPFDFVVVEGAGGLMSPLADGLLNIDYWATLRCELVLVSANRLGTVNQTLLSLAAFRQRVEPLGKDAPPVTVYLNHPNHFSDPSIASNAAEIRRYAPDIPMHEVAHNQSSLEYSLG